MRLNLDKYHDFGLLVLRVGLGAIMIGHGWPKLIGGAARWKSIGAAMGALGIHFAPTFWGFMAMMAENLGGVLIAVGLFFRPALAFLLVPTMIVAMLMHMQVRHDPFNTWSHPAALLVVFVAMILIGPGKLSLDAKVRGRA